MTVSLYAIALVLGVIFTSFLLAGFIYNVVDENIKYSVLCFISLMIMATITIICADRCFTRHDTENVIRVNNIERIDTLWRNNEIIGYEIIINKEE